MIKNVTFDKNTFSTETLAVELVALGLDGTVRVAIAGFATFAGCDLPVIGGAEIAGKSLDVGQTRTLTRLTVANIDALRRVGAQQVARARRALLDDGVAVVAFLTHIAGESFRVEETLLALAGASVAVAGFRQIDVVAALAWTAASAHHLRIAVIVVGADVAARTSVAFLQCTIQTISSSCFRVYF